MKKISSLLLLVCFSVLLFVSCNKKDSGETPAYYMKATIDGTAKTYTANPIAMKLDVGGTYSLSMSASAGSSSLESLGLQITQTNGAIAAGTYTESASMDYAIGGVYNPGSSDIAAIFGAGIKLSASSPLKIVITEITSSKASGTFSGEFFDNSGAGSNSVLITNGEFSLPIQ